MVVHAATVVHILCVELVLSPIGAQGKARALTEEMCYLGVEVMEEIVERDFVFVGSRIVVDDSEDGACDEVEP